jgi:hypothetical protein
MIFDFEDVDEGASDQSLSFSRQALVDQPPVVARSRKAKSRGQTNLSTSFSGLRPASLPPPSNIRPPRSQHGSDASFSLSTLNPWTLRKEKAKATEDVVDEHASGDSSERDFKPGEVLRSVQEEDDTSVQDTNGSKASNVTIPSSREDDTSEDLDEGE